MKSLDKNSQQHSLSNSATVTSTTTFDINTKSAAGLSNNHNNNNYSTLDHYQSSNLSSEESINQIIKTPSTPHQHFHKKYLRETLKQQDEEKKQQEQSHIQNAHMSSYIVTKNQSEGRYIFADDRDFMTSYNNNNNNNIQSNYEKSHEYDLSTKIIDYATPKANYSSGSSVASSSSSSPSPKQKQHPNNIPYDPLVHTASKPPYSFRWVAEICLKLLALMNWFSLKFLNLHGHRGLAPESAAGQGDLRVDHSTFSIFQDGTHRLEEQRATQFVAQQMLSESRKGCRELISLMKTSIHF